MNHDSLTAEAVAFANPSRGWHAALIASVLLHLVVLMALLQFRFGTRGSTVADTPRQVVAVLLRPRAIEKEKPSAIASPEPQLAPAETTDGVAEPPAPASPASNLVEATAESAPSVSPALPQGQGTLTQDDIRASIAKFSAEFKGQLTADWVSDCLGYRERYPTRQCPQQRAQETSGLTEGKQIADTVFASVTRADRHQDLTKSLLQENESLQELMEAGGVLGGLARERYYLNREYVFYLNGNFNFGAWNFVKAGNASNGNLEFMRSFMQFQCKESPCIYEFTGIGAKPVDSDEEGINESRRQ